MNHPWLLWHASPYIYWIYLYHPALWMMTMMILSISMPVIMTQQQRCKLEFVPSQNFNFVTISTIHYNNKTSRLEVLLLLLLLLFSPSSEEDDNDDEERWTDTKPYSTHTNGEVRSHSSGTRTKVSKAENKHNLAINKGFIMYFTPALLFGCFFHMTLTSLYHLVPIRRARHAEEVRYDGQQQRERSDRMVRKHTIRVAAPHRKRFKVRTIRTSRLLQRSIQHTHTNDGGRWNK